MAFRLTIICAVAALILGIVNIVAEPLIIERKRIEKEMALKTLSDGENVGVVQYPVDSVDIHMDLMALLVEHGVIGVDDDLDEKELITSIYPVDEAGTVTRYILQLEGSGYGGKMILLAVFNLDGSFVKAKLMDNNETPGLGKKAEDTLYYNMYMGRGISSDPVPVSKRALADSDAEAVSGSTITFNGISKALALGSDYVKLLGGKN